MLSVDPPFALSRQLLQGVQCWSITVDLAVPSQDDFALELTADEVRILFSGSQDPHIRCREQLACRMPSADVKINVEDAKCKFSRKNRQLSISWSSAPSKSRLESSECGGSKGCPGHGAAFPTDPGPRPVATVRDSKAGNLEERIAALREECGSVASALPAPGSLGDAAQDVRDRRLAKTVAGQISKMCRDAQSEADPEQLAGIIDTALSMSGRAADSWERGRLVILVAREVDPALSHLRTCCFEQAVALLFEAREAGGCPWPASQAALVMADGLYNAGLAWRDRDDEAAEGLLREALASLGRRSGKEFDSMRATVLHALAEMGADGTGEHLEKAGELLAGVQAQKSEEAARAELGFAAAADARRLPIRAHSFSDEQQRVTIYVRLDEALFSGASAAVRSCEEHVQAHFDAGSETSLELRIAAPAGAGASEVACWVLRLAPLKRPVVPGATKVKLKNGVLSLALRKKDAALWHDGLIGG